MRMDLQGLLKKVMNSALVTELPRLKQAGSGAGW